VIFDAKKVSLARSNWMHFLNDIQIRLHEVEDVWLDRIEIVRLDTRTGSPSNRFNSARKKVANPVPELLKLRLEGRLLDVSNPLSTVSQESNKRVSALLDSFAASEFIDRLEDERFDNNLPGILKFNFTLVVDSTRPLQR
jgi:type IV pilus assembly protein PilM